MPANESLVRIFDDTYEGRDILARRLARNLKLEQLSRAFDRLTDDDRCASLCDALRDDLVRCDGKNVRKAFYHACRDMKIANENGWEALQDRLSAKSFFRFHAFWIPNRVLNARRLRRIVLWIGGTLATTIILLLITSPGFRDEVFTLVNKVGSTVSFKSRVQKMEANLQQAAPAGTVVAFAGASSKIPDGWALCNGEEVSRDRNSELFGVIGETYGAGDGKTTFNLPDYRGLFLRAVDDPDGPGGRPAAGRDPDAASRKDVNGNLGGAVGSRQGDSVGPHVHEIEEAIEPRGNWADWHRAGGWSEGPAITHPNHKTDKNKDGNNEYTKETRPHNIYVNYIIRLRK